MRWQAFWKQLIKEFSVSIFKQFSKMCGKLKEIYLLNREKPAYLKK